MTDLPKEIDPILLLRLSVYLKDLPAYFYISNRSDMGRKVEVIYMDEPCNAC